MKGLLRSLVAVVFFCFALGQTTLVDAQTLTGGALKANLDLPFDAGLLTGEGEDEDAPEIITFYAQQYEGDGVFFTIDRSGSMNQGELQIAKREVSRSIMEFSDRVQFGIVFFDRGITKFPANGRAADATPSMKAAGLNWVQSVPGGGGSCCREGLAEALKYSNTSSSRRKVVIYVGDGGGSCNGGGGSYLKQTLSVVKAQNFQRAQVNTVGVMMSRGGAEQFLKSLARMNGGTYVNKTR